MINYSTDAKYMHKLTNLNNTVTTFIIPIKMTNIQLTWWFSKFLCERINGLWGANWTVWGNEEPNSLKCDNWFVIAIVLSSTTVTIDHIGSKQLGKNYNLSWIETEVIRNI